MNRILAGYSRRLVAQNVPGNSGSLTCGHAAWPKALALALVLGLGVSVGHGQWLETTISLGQGSGPTAVCYNSQNNKVYCANSRARSVTVIDCGADSVLCTDTAGVRPYAICHNPLNNKVYCVNRDGKSVSVIYCATDSVICTIPVGDAASGIAHNPVQNRLYVPNYGSATISVLRDSMSGVEETPSSEVRATKSGPTVVRGVLFLPGDRGPGTVRHCWTSRGAW